MLVLELTGYNRTAFPWFKGPAQKKPDAVPIEALDRTGVDPMTFATSGRSGLSKAEKIDNSY